MLVSAAGAGVGGDLAARGRGCRCVGLRLYYDFIILLVVIVIL
jgi:hypothetical protein